VNSLPACRTYGAKTGRRIFFEWTLIAGQNDSPRKPRSLLRCSTGLDAHVNLIPLNPTAASPARPAPLPLPRNSKHTLRAASIPSTVRQRRGIDVAAGCGQLRAEKWADKAEHPTPNIQ